MGAWIKKKCPEGYISKHDLADKLKIPRYAISRAIKSEKLIATNDGYINLNNEINIIFMNKGFKATVINRNYLNDLHNKGLNKCSKCGEIKSIIFFNKDNSKTTGIRSSCKNCETIRHRNYRQNNKEKENKRKKLYWKKHPEKKREKQKRYRERNLDKCRERERNKSERDIKRMCDYYIVKLFNKNTVIKFDKKDIPKEIIELYRTNLTLKREIKNIYQGESNERKETVNHGT